jgi:hypothetical protein
MNTISDDSGNASSMFANKDGLENNASSMGNVEFKFMLSKNQREVIG